jgi:hypothetical protein
LKPITNEELIFLYALPLTVLRYTLYPDTVEVLAFQVSVTECCTGATPVPDKETNAGDPFALLIIEIPPFTLPATVGLNPATSVVACDGESATGVLPPVTE